MKGPKHIAIDCHFIREKIVSRDIKTKFVNWNDQLGDIVIKSLRETRMIRFVTNLVYMIYMHQLGGEY